MKKFDEYQKTCEQTDVGTSAQECIKPGWLYYLLGANGEMGELTEKVKKLFRDKHGNVDDEFKEMLTSEMGDVLWYLGRLASAFDIPLSDVAQNNLDKLFGRKERGTLHGDGDNR